MPAKAFLVLPDTNQAQQGATVSFANQQGDSQGASSTFFGVLFGAKTGIAPESAWDPVTFSFVCETTRSGLQEGLRKTLLDKYEFKDDFVPLRPPKLNKVIVATQKSNSSLLKRDGHQVSSQVPVVACPNAIGIGLTELAAVHSTLSESDQLALSNIAEGLQLLADHQYRFSLHRQTFIKPALNILSKTTADTASIDEWLFAVKFAEKIEDAQAYKKTRRGRYAAFNATQVSQTKSGFCGKQENPCSKMKPASPSRGTFMKQNVVEEVIVPLSDQTLLTQVKTAGCLAFFLTEVEGSHFGSNDLEHYTGLQNCFPQPPPPPPPSLPVLNDPVFSQAVSRDCDTEIQRLLLMGTIVKVMPTEDQFISSFFLIKKSSGGMRFIINLKELHRYIPPPLPNFKVKGW